MGEVRLKRYERWLNSASLFLALEMTTYLQVVHGVHSGIGFSIALFGPFAAALVARQWLRRRARAEVPRADWRVLRWLRAALMLRGEWWESPLQIGRAWLISGVVLAAIAYPFYGQIGAASLVGIVYPILVLAPAVWHFRHPIDGEEMAPPGWYPDPVDPSGHRYWNGERWTDSYSVGTQSPPIGTGS